MTNQEKVQLFRTIVNEMADLYAKKNENYGNSFGQLFETLGPVSGLVPLHNKLDRATNLVRGGKNDFESLEDTFKDLACYAIMNLIEMRNKKDQETSCDPIEHQEKVRDVLDYWRTTPWIVENIPLKIENPCLTCTKIHDQWNACIGCPKNSNVYITANGIEDKHE